jgi:hypothetical protein
MNLYSILPDELRQKMKLTTHFLSEVRGTNNPPDSLLDQLK